LRSLAEFRVKHTRVVNGAGKALGQD